MTLNSFCVIVYRHGFVIHHERPQKMTAAIDKYNELVNKYMPYDGGPVHFASPGNFSDEWIEEYIKRWKGNAEMAANILIPFRCLSSKKEISVELIHSSQS